MQILFMDTETTGKYKFKSPLTHPSQPHMVQLACILDDRNQKTIQEYDTIIDTGEVEIPLGATAVHGITTARAKLEGVELESALRMFDKLCLHTDLIVCHNTEFDLKIMQSAYHRAGRPNGFGRIKTYCTMKNSTDVLKLPGRWGYKWPTLEEAYRVLVDPEGFKDAHDAMVDTRACREIYYKLNGGGQ